MSGPLYRAKPFFQDSNHGKLRLKMDLVSETDPQTNEVKYIKHPVFSLEETHTGKVLWKRQYDWRRNYTKGLFVSDSGWSVLHLGRDNPRLHVITPAGEEVLIVGIYHSLCSRPERPSHWSGPWDVWSDEHVCVSTAGTFWTMNARIRFEHAGPQIFFICRTEWGRYLVLDLSAARVMSEAEASPELSALLRPVDQSWALEILKQACRSRAELECAIEQRVYPDPLPAEMDELYDNLEIALQIVRQDGVKAAAEDLMELQNFRGPLYEGDIVAAPDGQHGKCHYDPAREWIHLTMLAIGVKPAGLAFRWFGLTDAEAGTPFLELPERIPDRARLLKSLKAGMRIDEAVRLAGAPEAILGRWNLRDVLPDLPKEEGTEYERWEYDDLDADGKPVTWGLLWRLSHVDPVQQESDGPRAHGLPSETKDKRLAVLISVTRFDWTDAYRQMRERGY